LGGIIEKAFTLKTSHKDDWHEVTKKITWILTTLRQREDFTDEQIIIIGLCLDEWTVDWISLVGREGMTNYTHFMTSGHIVYYLKYWRNFYRYSNQGWEQFNSKYRYILPQNAKGGIFRHAWRIRVKNKAYKLAVFASLFLAYRGC
jgi:hypothetical protein